MVGCTPWSANIAESNRLSGERSEEPPEMGEKKVVRPRQIAAPGPPSMIRRSRLEKTGGGQLKCRSAISYIVDGRIRWSLAIR